MPVFPMRTIECVQSVALWFYLYRLLGHFTYSNESIFISLDDFNELLLFKSLSFPKERPPSKICYADSSQRATTV